MTETCRVLGTCTYIYIIDYDLATIFKTHFQPACDDAFNLIQVQLQAEAVNGCQLSATFLQSTG